MELSFERLWHRMLHLYCEEDPSQIAHTQCVMDYTARISAINRLSERRHFLLQVAALLHEIGCPAAREKYGKSLPQYQQEEGRKIVESWLADEPDFSEDEVRYIADIVGAHHEWSASVHLHFEPLYEADLLVNLLEGYYPREKAPDLCRKMVRTAGGIQLFCCFFPEISMNGFPKEMDSCR